MACQFYPFCLLSPSLTTFSFYRLVLVVLLKITSFMISCVPTFSVYPVWTIHRAYLYRCVYSSLWGSSLSRHLIWRDHVLMLSWILESAPLSLGHLFSLISWLRVLKLNVPSAKMVFLRVIISRYRGWFLPRWPAILGYLCISCVLLSPRVTKNILASMVLSLQWWRI